MDTLIVEAEKFVVDYFNTHLDSKFVYHNLSHTKRVVKSTQEIIENLEVNERETKLLLIAAWFHDTGYAKEIEEHERAGVVIVKDFLQKHNASEEDITVISELIMATKMGHSPTTLLQKIIIDADCAHIGSKNFSDLSELLRKEWELTKGTVLTENEWIDENIKFLTNMHKFYTTYTAKNWQKRKGKNLSNLLKTKSKIALEASKLQTKKAALKFKKNKIQIPERGIETMFRVTLKNHITLSDIADTKANILLSVNAIIISLVLSTLVSKLDKADNAHLIIPTIIFTLFTVISMVLSILATRPNVTEGKFDKKDVEEKKVNLLFFGNFHKMSLPDFEWAISEVMKDKDYLYGSLTKDLYFLGKVLDRKYKILRLTYLVFMIGIIVSVIAFGIAFALRPELISDIIVP